MKTVEFVLEGVSPISFSKPVDSTKNTGESNDAYAKRVAKEHLHMNPDGSIYIPPMAIKNVLVACAKYLGQTIPSKGKSTWTKYFDAGILLTDPVELSDKTGKPIKADDVPVETLFLPASGVRGDGKRVWKYYPTLPPGWLASGTIMVLDPLLETNIAKIREHLEHAGKFIGLHRWRPQCGGLYGRYSLKKFTVA